MTLRAISLNVRTCQRKQSQVVIHKFSGAPCRCGVTLITCIWKRVTRVSGICC